MHLLGLSLLSWLTSESTETRSTLAEKDQSSDGFPEFGALLTEEAGRYEKVPNPPDGLAYIPSTGQGEDKNVHHRLPDGTAVTYDDIRRAVAEGRGDEDVSPYFNGQTNEQALAALGLSRTLEAAPEIASTLVALSQRSWFSLASSLTDTFGLGDSIRTAMKGDETKPKI